MSRRVENPVIEELARKAHLDKTARSQLFAASRTSVYGPNIGTMADYALKQDKVPAGTAAKVLLLSAGAFNYSERRYRAENPNHGLRDEALERHRQNIATGMFEMVAPEAGLTFAHGRAQTTRGNRFMERADQEVREAIPQLHFGTLFRGGGDKPDTINYGDIENLSHLSLCNLAIGQIAGGVSDFLANLPDPGRQRIIDIGAGRYGHTTKEVISNILEKGSYPETAYTVIETAPEFYVDLREHMEAVNAASSLGLNFRHNPAADEPISEFGTFTTLNADATKAIKSGQLLEGVGKNDITIVVANYSFHSIPQSQKTEIIREVAKLPNAIMLLGDAVESTDEVNLRYFGLGANVGYDAGNQTLTPALKEAGFEVVDLRKEKPEALEIRAHKKLVKNQVKRGPRLWVAYSGELAQKALGLGHAA